ncbi:BA14K family protein [Mesorhizobium sp. LMG 17147]|uniref:BA14K family protein n=1 Tax=Mesorhizobium sp. LMG 17147 TaxID=2963091 RepID=UPI0020C9A6E2|nr:BA14K family protein [Mesorhizobium sp. LMG 17147]MCP9232629.1 BA14K family protein [Mesorhizobium sp. LMG 17147]
MKALFAIFGGFVLTLAVFASGLAFATWLLIAKPVRPAAPVSSVAELWAKDPRPVNSASQRLERLPARPVPVRTSEVDRTARPADTAAASTPDTTATGSIKPAVKERQTLPVAHVEWCASRYRSYRPNDNRYTSYSGQQRPCISPYLDITNDGSYVEASDTSPIEGYPRPDETGDAGFSSDHVQYCFGRYRSYRPEDNSYQPYSGGPRRQCE